MSKGQRLTLAVDVIESVLGEMVQNPKIIVEANEFVQKEGINYATARVQGASRIHE
jgi:hypothetical protein